MCVLVSFLDVVVGVVEGRDVMWRGGGVRVGRKGVWVGGKGEKISGGYR